LWHAETGSIEPLSFEVRDGRTAVPLQLDPWGSVFVVFRKPTRSKSVQMSEFRSTTLATVSGPWTVAFEAGYAAPAPITMTQLIDWSRSDDLQVKYFSGAGTYTGTVHASGSWFRRGARLWIDLGDVKNLAVVSVNGKQIGEVWHVPYRLDVTSALKPGNNKVEVKVLNAWVNRLIGDEQPNAQRFTDADIHPYKADSPLLPSGLLGPVTVLAAESQ